MTIYGSRQDQREDNRSWRSPNRAHAVCRRIVASPSQNSHWYGAHYWAACGVLSSNPEQTLQTFHRSFTIEVTGDVEKALPRRYEALWRLAVKRVWATQVEAIALATSVLW